MNGKILYPFEISTKFMFGSGYESPGHSRLRLV